METIVVVVHVSFGIIQSCHIFYFSVLVSCYEPHIYIDIATRNIITERISARGSE